MTSTERKKASARPRRLRLLAWLLAALLIGPVLTLFTWAFARWSNCDPPEWGIPSSVVPSCKLFNLQSLDLGALLLNTSVLGVTSIMFLSLPALLLLALWGGICVIRWGGSS
jgi:hypothetical protein